MREKRKGFVIKVDPCLRKENKRFVIVDVQLMREERGTEVRTTVE